MTIPYPAPSPSPSTPIVTNVKFEDIRSVHVHITWINGLGDNRIVVVSERSDLLSPNDGTNWNFNPEYKTELYSNDTNGTGVSWVVYKGDLENVTVYNLNPKTKYYFYFFEYNIVNGINVYMSDFTIGNITTSSVDYVSSLRAIVIDEITEIGIENSDITIVNRNGNIISNGRSNSKGVYNSKYLPIGGVHLVVSAPGYNKLTIESVFIKNLKDNKSSYKSPNIFIYNIKLSSIK